jgi:hypothetical protein
MALRSWSMRKNRLSFCLAAVPDNAILGHATLLGLA